MDQPAVMRRPFVYANGRRCSGHIFRIKGDGSRRHIRKIGFHCSEKSDHAGAVPNPETKNRMEVYPDQIPADRADDVLALFEDGSADYRFD